MLVLKFKVASACVSMSLCYHDPIFSWKSQSHIPEQTFSWLFDDCKYGGSVRPGSLTCSCYSDNLTPGTMSMVITNAKTVTICLILLQTSENIALGKATKTWVTKKKH